MGVFLATDALLFYFFWELALIPVYFLCSQWGGERRIQVTFKFFVYTFVGVSADAGRVDLDLLAYAGAFVCDVGLV